MTQRVYQCGGCGLKICRDHNAAINICAKGFSREPHGPAGDPRRLGALYKLCCDTDPSFGKATLTDTHNSMPTSAPTRALRYISPYTKLYVLRYAET